jgi:Family of unknown function (DUF6152)
MRPAVLVLAVLAVVIAANVPARAHHSHPIFYDSCASLTIDGEIESVQWKNPHVLIDLIANDGKAYRAEWTSAGSLERTSIEPPKAGDRVVVRGNPMRDVAYIRAKFPSLTLTTPAKPVVDLIQIRRASDGWRWARAEPTSQDCGRK